MRSSSQSLRWRSASSARSGRSAAPGSRSASRPTICSRSVCVRCLPCSTSCSTRATRQRPVPTTCVPTSATRRSGSASCSPSSCPTRRRCSGCSRSCCCRTRAAPLASGTTARSCCSRIRTGHSGIEGGSTRGSACSSGPFRCGAQARTSSRRRSRRRTPRVVRDEEIVLLYEALVASDPSPVVRLNHAVAVALAGDVDEGLRLITEIDGLDEYHLMHAARADLHRRLDQRDEAAAAYRRALELTTSAVETRYLKRRLAEVS